MAGSNLINDLLAQFAANPRRVFARLANEYRKAGDYQSAIDICRTHVPLVPTYISGHIVLGQSLFESGQFDDARSAFETALSLDPENLIALRHLGDIAREQGDVPAARGWYERLLEVDPQNEDAEAHLSALGAEPTPEQGEPTPAEPVPEPVATQAAGDGAGGAEPEFVDLSALMGAPGDEAAPQAPAAEHTLGQWSDMEPRLVDVDAHAPPLPGTTPGDAADASEPPVSEPALELQGWGDEVSWGAPPEPIARDEAGHQPAQDNGAAPPNDAASGPGTDAFDFMSLRYPDLGLSSTEELPAIPSGTEAWLGGEVDLPAAAAPVEEAAPAPELAPAPEPPPLPVVEVAPVATPAAHTPVATPPEGTPGTFVTATMAELYLRQGHLAQAVSVYQQLVERSPDDAALRKRLSELDAAPVAHDDGSVARSVREFFARLAARRAPATGSGDAAAAPPADADRASSPVAEEAPAPDAAAPPAAEAADGPLPQPVGADGFFAEAAVASEDAARAETLAAAFPGPSPAPQAPQAAQATPAGGSGHESFSLDHVFRQEAVYPPDVPATLPEVSFDQFFSDSSRAEAAPPSTAAAPPPAEPAAADADLEMFQAWLEGLKK